MNKKQKLEPCRRSKRLQGINALNDDCMLEIFKYLSFSKKLEIERVSKRWNDLSKRSWGKVHIFKLNDSFMREFDIFPTKQLACTKITKIIISRCGDYLQDVIIDNNCTNIILKCIFDQCKIMKSIEFGGSNDIIDYNSTSLFIKTNHLQYLSMRFATINGEFFDKLPDKLNTIKFYNCKIDKPEHFYSFLVRSKNLKTIIMERCNENFVNSLVKAAEANHLVNLLEITLNLEITGRFSYIVDKNFPLSKLWPVFKNSINLKKIVLYSENLDEKVVSYFPEDSLESISLYWTRMNVNYVVNLLPCCKKLNELVLHDVILAEEELKTICTCLNLRKISIYYVHMLKLIDGLNCLGNLNNLEELIFISFHSLDGSLLSIVKCKKLKLLQIADCSNITERDLINIVSSLENLEIFEIIEMQQVTDKLLKNMTNLKEFHCESCDKITNRGLKKFLQNSPNLRKLEVLKCWKVTNSLVDDLLDTIEIRGKKTVLNINISGISIEDINRTSSPYIKVISPIEQS